LASENLENGSSAEHYLTGSASAYTDKDRRITSCAGAESSMSSKLRGSDLVPMNESSVHRIMLSDNTVSGAVSWLVAELNHMHVFTKNCIYLEA
jgi:hypothetical protein